MLWGVAHYPFAASKFRNPPVVSETCMSTIYPLLAVVLVLARPYSAPPPTPCSGVITIAPRNGRCVVGYGGWSWTISVTVIAVMFGAILYVVMMPRLLWQVL